MKSKKSLIIMVLVILFLLAGLYFVNQYNPTKPEDVTKENLITLFSGKVKDIIEVSVTDNGDTYTLIQKDTGWAIKEMPEASMQSQKTSVFLNLCCNITAKEMIEANPTDLSAYGLSTPNRSVTVLMKDGSSVTLHVGDTSVDGSVCYVQTSTESSVYTKDASDCNRLIAPITDLLEQTIYSVPGEDLASITIEKQGAHTIGLVREIISQKGKDRTLKWYMTTPVEKAANEYTIAEKVEEKILTLMASGIVMPKDSGGDYGFTTPKAQYTITTYDNTVTQVLVGNSSDDLNTYVKLKDSSIIYTVRNSSLSFLNVTYLDLVERIIHVENMTDVSKVTVSNGDKTYTLVVPKDLDNGTYVLNSKTVSKKDFQDAYIAIVGITMDDFTDKGTDARENVTITYDKRDGSQVVVSYGHFDDRNYIAKINGKGNQLVRTKQIDTMFEVLANTEKQVIQ